MKEYGTRSRGLWCIKPINEPVLMELCEEREPTAIYPVHNHSVAMPLTTSIQISFDWRMQSSGAGEFVVGIRLLFIPDGSDKIRVSIDHGFVGLVEPGTERYIKQQILEAIESASKTTPTRGGCWILERIAYHEIDFNPYRYKEAFTRIMEFLHGDYLNSTPEDYS